MDEIIKATGSQFCYDYRELPKAATAEQIVSYCNDVRRQFLPITQAFDEQANSIWILRHFLAIKFAVAASVLSGSAHYALERNLLMGVPYFNYYTLLNCCRAFLLTSPDVVWQGKATMHMPHQTILNRTADLMKRLDRSPERCWQERLTAARTLRETYSYRFPATGLSLVQEVAYDPEATANFARLIAELAMLNSECFQGELRKRVPEDIPMVPITDLEWASVYDIAGVEVHDRDDHYRFGKFVYGWTRVSTLEVMTSDGMIEDFYGGWCASEPIDGNFDPDDWDRHLLVL